MGQRAVEPHLQALLTQGRGGAVELRGLALFQEPHGVALGVEEAGGADAGASQTDHGNGAHRGFYWKGNFSTASALGVENSHT